MDLLRGQVGAGWQERRRHQQGPPAAGHQGRARPQHRDRHRRGRPPVGRPEQGHAEAARRAPRHHPAEDRRGPAGMMIDSCCTDRLFHEPMLGGRLSPTCVHRCLAGRARRVPRQQPWSPSSRRTSRSPSCTRLGRACRGGPPARRRGDGRPPTNVPTCCCRAPSCSCANLDATAASSWP